MLFTTSLIGRLADKSRTFKDLIEDDFVNIANIDPLIVPPGMFLKDNGYLIEKSSQTECDTLEKD